MNTAMFNGWMFSKPGYKKNEYQSLMELKGLLDMMRRSLFSVMPVDKFHQEGKNFL